MKITSQTRIKGTSPGKKLACGTEDHSGRSKLRQFIRGRKLWEPPWCRKPINKEWRESYEKKSSRDEEKQE